MEFWEVTTLMFTVLLFMFFCSFVVSLYFWWWMEPPSASAEPATVVMPIEETCMLCMEPIAHGAQCRELRCSCLLHVECLLDWWKGSVDTRPRREVESGILQLDCRKCRKTVSIPSYLPGVVNVVTRGEIQQAHL